MINQCSKEIIFIRYVHNRKPTYIISLHTIKDIWSLINNVLFPSKGRCCVESPWVHNRGLTKGLGSVLNFVNETFCETPLRRDTTGNHLFNRNEWVLPFTFYFSFSLFWSRRHLLLEIFKSSV